MEHVAQQTDRQIRHGFELAGRGAYYAARAEFVAALRLVAEGLDTERKSNEHGRALAAALTAMKEAEDFLPGRARIEADVDLRRLIAAHSTTVLKNAPETVTAMAATKEYFTFAQEQFSDAAGGEVSGSMGLYALGKLHNALAQKKAGLEIAAESKAMVYYQAALLTYPKNHLAANDLGVLLARYGKYHDARSMLEYSLGCQRLSATWHNLSVVYQRLNQAGLAHHAGQQAAVLEQMELARRRATVGTANGVVQWVDSQAFATTTTPALNAPYVYTRPPMQAARPSAEPGRLPAEGRNSVGIERSATARRPVERGSVGRYGTPQPPSSAERMSWGSGSYQR